MNRPATARPNGANKTAAPPEAAPETRLARELRRRKMFHAELAEILGVSETAVGRYLRPPDHPRHRAPRDPEIRARLKKWSGGKITIANFDDVVGVVPRARQEAAR